MNTGKISGLMIIFFGLNATVLQAQFKRASVIGYSNSAAQELHAADVDGDGDIDLVYSENWLNRDFGWFENKNGKGAFVKHVIAKEDKIQRTYVIDIDGDGNNDILFSGETDGELGWYKNDWTENFSRKSITTSLNNPKGVYAKDMDGDGDIDLIVASEGDNTITWFDNDGLENFTAKVVTTAAQGVIGVTAIDVDGDGEIDLVPASSGVPGICPDCRFSWFKNDGSENFSEQVISTSYEFNRQEDVKPVDMDNDGDIDFVVANKSRNKIRLFKNDGAENFTEHTLTDNFSSPSSIEVVDADGDGDLDVFLASDLSDQIAWLENEGNDNFTQHSIAVNIDGPNSINVIDLNGDSKVDIAVPLYGDKKFVVYEQIVRKPAFPNFKRETLATYAMDSREFDIQAVDLDYDGDMDFVAQSQRNNELAWYENDGSESFTYHFIATETNAHKLQVIDYDFDGDLDIFIHNEVTNNVYYYKNDGSEGFTKESLFNADADIRNFLAVDLDLDAENDLITTSFEDNKLYYYRNRNGNFSSYDIGSGTNATGEIHFDVADIDNDGKTDVVAAFNSDNSIIWYEYNGSTGFTPHTVSTTATSIKSIIAKDLENDGDIDIIANYNSKLYWLENDGNQVFTEKEISAGLANEIKVLDFDTDGDQDIVIGYHAGNGLTWFENNGSEEFKKHVIAKYNDAQGVEAFTITDLDSDNDLDIISISGFDKKIIWHENTTYGDLVTLGGVSGAMWRLISSPTEDATLEDLAGFVDVQGFNNGKDPTADKNVIFYDYSGAWESFISISGSLRSGYGYAVWTFDNVEDTLNFRGTEPANDVTVNLNKTTLQSSAYYTLVGNPFYSNYNLNALTVNSGTLQDNVHFWDANHQIYYVRDRTAASGFVINPMQGFWAEVANGSSATTLTFPTSGKTESSTSGTWLHKQANQKRGDISFSLQSKQGILDNSIRLSFREYAETGWDRADAGKLDPLSNTYATLSFVNVVEDKELFKAVESLPYDFTNSIELPMKLKKVGVAGEFTLLWEGISSVPEEWSFVLHDLVAGTFIDLSKADDYTFISSGDGNSEETRFVLKLQKSTSVGIEEAVQPENYSLSQNYPNPFNPSTTIGFALPQSGKVTLEVFDALGRKVATLLQGETRTAGRHTLNFDASSLSSGIYIYRLTAGNSVITKKLTLIK